MFDRRILLVFLLCLSFSLLGSCAEEERRLVVEKSRLRVTSPNTLKGVYRCAMGNFGLPQYGGTMAGTVVYPKANSEACMSFQDFDISFESRKQQPGGGGLPTLVLVDREECTFDLKAWNAQNAGAAAILVVDDKLETTITMDPVTDDFINKITIPSVLINKSLGDRIKKALSSGDTGVHVNLDWREALPHPDDRVEYEFWTDSNEECGPMCDNQMEFVKHFKGAAQIMEQKGYTRFAPHYISWSCPEGFSFRRECKSQCINHGRYCAEGDPEQDSTRGYDGKDVVVQNLRQACFFKVANESGKPWLWWDYVTDFTIRCPMKENKYTNECSNQVIQSLGMDIKKIESCVGDIEADVENPILEAEEKARIGKGSRGEVTVLPTLVINDRRYTGKLNKGAVLKAICSGFKETTEPAICLSEEIETNECRQENNGGCWQDKAAKITACKDTFRGKVCECPTVRGIKLIGDGYTNCKHPSNITTISWGVIGVCILGLVVALGVVVYVVYVVYKYKIRQDMDSEIREILAQYIPLDKQGGFPNQVHLEEV